MKSQKKNPWPSPGDIVESSCCGNRSFILVTANIGEIEFEGTVFCCLGFDEGDNYCVSCFGLQGNYFKGGKKVL